MENRPKLYEGQKYNCYQLSKLTDIPVQTLYKYIKGSRHINNMRTGNFLKIAKVEGISPEELYEKICEYLYK